MQFGAPRNDPVANLEDMIAQVHTVLLQLTELESSDIVTKAAQKNGIEAWRALHKRFAPFLLSKSVC